MQDPDGPHDWSVACEGQDRDDESGVQHDASGAVDQTQRGSCARNRMKGMDSAKNKGNSTRIPLGF